MNRDIDNFAIDLTNAGVPQAQITASRSVLQRIETNTRRCMSSGISDIINIFGNLLLLIIIFTIGVVRKTEEKEENSS